MRIFGTALIGSIFSIFACLYGIGKDNKENEFRSKSSCLFDFRGHDRSDFHSDLFAEKVTLI